MDQKSRVTKGSVFLSLSTTEFKLESIDQLFEMYHTIFKYISEVEHIFFDSLVSIQSIAAYIAKFSYENQNEIMVGSKFPIHIFKKVFLLYQGGQINRYKEYKRELKTQIDSFVKSKPERKEEAKAYIDNYDYLTNFLEGLG